jgi:hypothetical protein
VWSKKFYWSRKILGTWDAVGEVLDHNITELLELWGGHVMPRAPHWLRLGIGSYQKISS